MASAISIIPKKIRYVIACSIRYMCWGNLNYINHCKKTVYFFSVKPHARERLFAKYAKENGFSVTIFAIGKINDSDRLFFDNCFILNNLVELQLISWMLMDHLQHCFGLDGSKLYGFIKMRVNPVIIDIYDTCEGITSSYFLQKKMEAYVIQNAEAITLRDLRVKNLYPYINRECRADIFIPDTPALLLPKKIRKISNEDEIHLVSTGWIDGIGNNILRASENFCKNKIHVHIYYNPFQNKDTFWGKQYSDLEKKSEYFHIEKPIYGRDYIEEISKYDFGLSLYDQWTYDGCILDYSKKYMEHCGSSRVNDYISAGLTPIVCPIFTFQIKMIKELSSNYILADKAFYENPRDVFLKFLEQQEDFGHKSLNLKHIKHEQSLLLGKLYDDFIFKISKT